MEKGQKVTLENFGEFYDAHVRKIYDFIYYRTHHKPTAEDLTSAVFTKALENLDKYDPAKGEFGPWLYRIARNTVIDHYRSSRETSGLEDVWELPSSSNVERDADTAIQLEKIKKYLAELSPVQRDVVLLRVWDGLSHREIAEVLGISEANSKVTFSRTIAKLNKETAFAAMALILALISQ